MKLKGAVVARMRLISSVMAVSEKACVLSCKMVSLNPQRVLSRRPASMIEGSEHARWMFCWLGRAR